jgi:hypothetical protein
MRKEDDVICGKPSTELSMGLPQTLECPHYNILKNGDIQVDQQ